MPVLRLCFMDRQPQIPESQATQIREFVFAGRKIEAIKVLRQATPGMDLRDAKTVIDQLEEQLRRESPEKFTARKSGCGTAVLCCLLFVVGCVSVSYTHLRA